MGIMEEQWNKMKVRPKAKSFAPVGIKVAATLSKITINAKIIDKTESKIVNRKDILEKVKLTKVTTEILPDVEDLKEVKQPIEKDEVKEDEEIKEKEDEAKEKEDEVK